MDVFKQAEQKRADGLYDEAIALYDSALEREPDHVAGHAGRGECLRMLGRYREALQAFDEALTRDSAWQFALSGKSLALMSLGRFDEVPGVWRSAGVRPAHEDGWLALIDARIAEGDDRTALEIAGEAADQLPASGAIRARVAEGYRLQGRLEVSLMWAASALRRDPADPGALMTKAMALNGRGRFAEAEPVWQRLSALVGSSSEVQRGLRECRLAGGWRDASVIASISDGEVAFGIASALEEASEEAAALVFYERCLELLPGHVEAILGRGNALRSLGRTEDARTAYREVLAAEPDHPYALAGLADCERVDGHLERAVELFDRSLALAPDHPVALMGKASALNALGRFEEAFPLWTRALELEPGSDFARSGDAECRAGSGLEE